MRIYRLSVAGCKDVSSQPKDGCGLGGGVAPFAAAAVLRGQKISPAKYLH